MGFGLERIFKPYEFEDRASFFIKEIEKLSERYPTLLIEAENKTSEDLKNNSIAIKHLRSKNNEAKIIPVYKAGYRMDVDSANETKVLITVFGDRKKSIQGFRTATEKIAGGYSGKLILVNGITESDYSEFKYFLALIYSFK